MAAAFGVTVREPKGVRVVVGGAVIAEVPARSGLDGRLAGVGVRGWVRGCHFEECVRAICDRKYATRVFRR